MNFPEELTLQILKFVNPETLTSTVPLVCKDWLRISITASEYIFKNEFANQTFASKYLQYLTHPEAYIASSCRQKISLNHHIKKLAQERLRLLPIEAAAKKPIYQIHPLESLLVNFDPEKPIFFEKLSLGVYLFSSHERHFIRTVSVEKDKKTFHNFFEKRKAQDIKARDEFIALIEETEENTNTLLIYNWKTKEEKECPLDFKALKVAFHEHSLILLAEDGTLYHAYESELNDKPRFKIYEEPLKDFKKYFFAHLDSRINYNYSSFIFDNFYVSKGQDNTISVTNLTSGEAKTTDWEFVKNQDKNSLLTMKSTESGFKEIALFNSSLEKIKSFQVLEEKNILEIAVRDDCLLLLREDSVFVFYQKEARFEFPSIRAKDENIIYLELTEAMMLVMVSDSGKFIHPYYNLRKQEKKSA